MLRYLLGATETALYAAFGGGGTLGRDAKGEVVLLPTLRAAQSCLNRNLPDVGIELITASAEIENDANGHFSAFHEEIGAVPAQASNLCFTRDLILPRLLGGSNG